MTRTRNGAPKRQTNVLLTEYTRQQLRELCEVLGMSESVIVTMAIDMMRKSPEMAQRIDAQVQVTQA